jgi:hypothetical protein
MMEFNSSGLGPGQKAILRPGPDERQVEVDELRWSSLLSQALRKQFLY